MLNVLTYVQNTPCAKKTVQPISLHNVKNHILSFLAAPTFAEGQFGATSIQDKNDTQYTRMQQQTFAPCYPTFAFNPSAPVM